MVNLSASFEDKPATRQIKSSFYYDVLKKSGKLKQDFGPRTRTSSYDKHYLVHTDITGSGHGTSYPHRKDFAWNLLYLKQSWGANLNKSKQPNLQKSSSSSRSSNKSSRRESKSQSALNQLISKKPQSAPDHPLPPLRSRNSCDSFRSSVSGGVGYSAEQQKRRTTGSERSRITLDSIPENEPLKPTRSRAVPSEASTKKRHVITSSSRQSRRSDSKMSRYTASTYSSSLRSSQLPRLETRNEDSVTPSSNATSRMYRNQSRSSSVGTRWDEHEGRPLAEKRGLKPKIERERKVANTIKPAMLKSLVQAVSGELNTRSRVSSHLESKEVGSAPSESYSVKKHQPFTTHSFEVEKSASTTRLRSSLYKTEEASRKPTIFRSNLTETKKQKKFNPRYHGEITRPIVVDNHSHKMPLEGFSPAKWVPKVNELAQKSGPWTTYDAITSP